MECGGSGREKRGKKEKKKRVRVRVWRRKKEERNMDEKKEGKNKINNEKLKLRNAITIFSQ